MHGDAVTIGSRPVQVDAVAESIGQSHTTSAVTFFWRLDHDLASLAYQVDRSWTDAEELFHEQSARDAAHKRGFPRGHAATRRFAKKLLRKIDRNVVRQRHNEMVRRLRQCKIEQAADVGSEPVPEQISVVEMPIQPNAPDATV